MFFDQRSRKLDPGTHFLEEKWFSKNIQEPKASFWKSFFSDKTIYRKNKLFVKRVRSKNAWDGSNATHDHRVQEYGWPSLLFCVRMLGKYIPLLGALETALSLFEGIVKIMFVTYN